MTAALYHRKLERALDRMGGLYAWPDIRERLDDGRMQSFAIGNSMLVTQINVFPRARALDFLLAVGDIKDCRAIHDAALGFADRLDIPVIRAFGRRGWIADARERGWRTLTVNQVYVKEL